MDMIESYVPTAQVPAQWPEMLEKIRYGEGTAVTITENGSPTAVLLPFDTFVGLLASSENSSHRETAYLLSSPANAARLLSSMKAIKEGRIEQHDLIDVDDEEE